MTRTLFVGEPRERDLAVYELGRAARSRRAIDALEAAVRGAAPRCRTGAGSTPIARR